MSIIGRAPVNPFVFYSGKFAGYFVWFSWILSVTGVVDFTEWTVPLLQKSSFFTFGMGLCVGVVSLINLGKSTRLGLPEEDTELQTRGLYRLSRNPMYVAFHLLTVSAVLYTCNPLILFLGIYCVVVYHYIIRAEEQFLERRFGRLYDRYKREVRRYL